jgi:pimeloyl-ACP methyl ester carboxylesterase
MSAVLALALLVASPSARSASTEVVVVEVRPRVTMRYLAAIPDGHPRAAVILFAGGNGLLRLSPSGSIGTDLDLNFLIRSRDHFRRRGFFVASLDVASDRQDGMNGAMRLSEQHARDIGRVATDVKNRAGGAAVWLIGNSAGTLSVANAAARLSHADQAARPSGIVLTTTMTTLGAVECGKTVYEAALADIRMPVLVVSHERDACPCTPGDAVAGARLLGACPRAPAKEHRIFTGGSAPISGPCDARAPHGFFGIEDDVVEFIAGWIRTH